MGDRITLETAEERELWRASWLAYFHTSGITDREGHPLAPVDVADQAVRAYRERLPEGSVVSNEDWHAVALDAIGRCNAHSRNLSAVRDALSSVIDIGEDDAELAGFIDQLAERGPTEGASDDGPPLRVRVDGLEVRASDEYSVHMSGFAFEGHEGGKVGELHVGSVTSPGTVLISMAEGASDAAKVRAKCDQLDVMAERIVDSTDMADGIRSATAAVRGCMLSPERPESEDGLCYPEPVSVVGVTFSPSVSPAPVEHNHFGEVLVEWLGRVPEPSGAPESDAAKLTALIAAVEHQVADLGTVAWRDDAVGRAAAEFAATLRAALDTAKGGGATSMRERVESALSDIEVELATKHAKHNGVHYTDALGLCLKWVRAALDPQDV